MDFIIFLTGAAAGGLVTWAWRTTWARQHLQNAPEASPAPGAATGHSEAATRPPRAFPSLTEADLEDAIQRTIRDERWDEKHGYHSLAVKERADRERYETELAYRRGERAAV